ncbi:TRIC cation channel family protein, partial [Paracoccus sp. (in: a-proteobacteria)]
MSFETLVPFLDYTSVLIFALTGALVASRAQLDLVGFIFFATLTGIGGG